MDEHVACRASPDVSRMTQTKRVLLDPTFHPGTLQIPPSASCSLSPLFTEAAT